MWNGRIRREFGRELLGRKNENVQTVAGSGKYIAFGCGSVRKNVVYTLVVVVGLKEGVHLLFHLVHFYLLGVCWEVVVTAVLRVLDVVELYLSFVVPEMEFMVFKASSKDVN